MTTLDHLDLIENHRDVASSFIVAEGPKIVLRLILSDLKIVKIYTDQTQLSFLRNELSNPSLLRTLDLEVLEKSKIQEIAGYKMHQGIIGIAIKPALIDLNDIESPFIILNRLHNAENVGSVIRSANAFGITNFIFDKETSYPFLRRCIRVSMGGALYSRFAIVDSLKEVLPDLHSRFNIAALEINEHSKSIYSITSPFKLDALIVGSEHEGVASDILETCNHTLQIPMTQKHLSSLNVGVATAIAVSYLRESKVLG